MYVYICECTRVRRHAWINSAICVCINIYIYIYAYLPCMHVLTYLCQFTKRANVCACTAANRFILHQQVCINICIGIHAQINKYIYIYIYTYIYRTCLLRVWFAVALATSTVVQ